MSNERKYLLMTSKHSDKKHPLFWGSLTKDDEARSFSGYTNWPDKAEHYPSEEIYKQFADPIELTPMLPLPTIFGRVARFTPADWWQHSNDDDIYVITEEEIHENL
ncbi:hypothetical protein [Lacticaseibacillus porcinae]|uniref:hypothetical protein n=1 Tax=Lacticaseibacillus porcinae TaxID=1123687 RepID=UPI000F775B72|nr:hypothetical protein [Lacticaseibacillus porcinae]